MKILCGKCFSALGLREALMIGVIGPRNCYGCGSECEHGTENELFAVRDLSTGQQRALVEACWSRTKGCA